MRMFPITATNLQARRGNFKLKEFFWAKRREAGVSIPLPATGTGE